MFFAVVINLLCSYNQSKREKKLLEDNEQLQHRIDSLQAELKQWRHKVDKQGTVESKVWTVHCWWTYKVCMSTSFETWAANSVVFH